MKGAPTIEALVRRTPIKQVIQASGVLPYEPFGFTNCVRLKDVLYLSGIAALDPQGKVLGSDIATQTRETFNNIRRLLQAGGSDLDQILQMTSFVVDLDKNGTGYVETRKTILVQRTYTSATIGVSALMVPGLLLEVQCTAAVA
jgi:enamine deaminase RidA (YjgF/YER057c/UK114 family)